MNPQEIIELVLEKLHGMWRFRWAALALAWVIVLVGTVFVYSLPDVYRATAQVFVDTNSLLRPLMRGLTADQNPLDAIQVVNRTVLTRPNLESVAYATDLTLNARTRADVDDIVSDLQRDIRLSGGRDNVFTVEYTHESRTKAVEVVDALLDTLTETAIGDQGNEAEITERALREELELLEEELNAADAEIARFKTENVGFLPGEAGDFSERLQRANAAARQTESEIERLLERRGELERQLVGEEPVFGIMPMAASGGGACSQRSTISSLEAERAALSVDFTSLHPRVERLTETIEGLEAACLEELQAAAALGRTGAVPSVSVSENPVYQNMQIQLTDVEVELADLRALLRSQRADIAQLEQDVDKIAQVELQLKELTRTYELTNERYQQVYSRWQNFESTKRLDSVANQVQYQRIEPPFAPEEAAGPFRRVYLGGVALVAAAAGGALAFVFNLLLPAFFTRRSLERSASLPVLGSVSMIFTDAEIAKNSHGRIRWFAGTAILVIGVLIAIILAPPASDLVRGVIEGFSL